MIEYTPKEYTVDQMVIPRIQLVFLCLFVGLLGITLYYVISQRKNGLKCQILEFFSAILVVFIVSLTLFLANWINLINNDNKELPYVDLFGNIFWILGNGMFLLLLIITGQGGWGLSVHYGQNIFQIILNYLITFSMIGLSWSIYILYIFKSQVPDDDNSANSYLYYMDTIPGYILASLYLVIMVFFIFSNHLYRQDEIDESKKKLILIFTWVFISWFVIHPVVIIIAHFVDPYVKYRVVTIINLCVNSIFFSLLVYLFRPKLSNSSGHFLIAGGDMFNDDNYDEENPDQDDELLRNHASSSGKSNVNLKKESIFNSLHNMIKNHHNNISNSNNNNNNSNYNSNNSIDISDNNSTSSINNNHNSNRSTSSTNSNNNNNNSTNNNINNNNNQNIDLNIAQ